MRPNYYNSGVGGRRSHSYVCGIDSQGVGIQRCQSMQGVVLDEAISKAILETLTPMAINNAIEIEEESRRRKAASDNYFLMQVERARYETELAKKRYMSVDPQNRLVAFELERLWNERIVDLAKAEEELNRHNREKATGSGYSVIDNLSGLPDDVRGIWNSEKMRVQDKKRILRCLIENVTITKGTNMTIMGILFKTGATKVIECENAKPGHMYRVTPAETVEYIREKSVKYTASDISDMLNQKGLKTGMGEDFTAKKVRWVMQSHSILSLEQNLRSMGYLYSDEKAAQLGISIVGLNKLRKNEKIDGWVKVDGAIYMYAPA